MSFRAVFIALVIGFGLVLGGWLINSKRPRVEIEQASAAGVLDFVASRAPGPDLAAQRSEDVAAVRRALRRLSRTDREIVLARKDDVSIDQLAVTTGRTFKQMRSHIDKLFERLRADLGGSADTGDEDVEQSPGR